MAQYTMQDEIARKKSLNEPRNYGVPKPQVGAPAGAMPGSKPNVPQPAVTQTGNVKMGNTNIPLYAPTGPVKHNVPKPQGTGVYQGAGKEADDIVKSWAHLNPSVNYNNPVPPVSTPTSAPSTDYASIAASRTAAALANKRSLADQQKSSLDRSYQRANQITQDNRTLENAQFNENSNPFSGKFVHDKAVIGRERTLADESTQGNLLAQKANIDQLLNDYENATYDEQIRIADELQRADRDYQLSLAQLTGNINGQRTLAGQNQDYAKQTDQRDYNYQVGRDNVGDARFDQQFDYQQGRDNVADSQFNQKFTFEKAQQEWQNTFAKEQFSEQKASDLWERTFKDKSFNQSVKEAAQRIGLDYSQLAQNQKQFVTEQAFREKGFKLDQSKFAWSKDPSNPDNIAKPKETDYKSNPEFSQDFQDIISDPNGLQFVKGNSKALIDAYGIEGYQALLKAVEQD